MFCSIPSSCPIVGAVSVKPFRNPNRLEKTHLYRLSKKDVLVLHDHHHLRLGGPLVRVRQRIARPRVRVCVCVCVTVSWSPLCVWWAGVPSSHGRGETQKNIATPQCRVRQHAQAKLRLLLRLLTYYY